MPCSENIPGVSNFCHLDKIWSLSLLRSLVFFLPHSHSPCSPTNYCPVSLLLDQALSGSESLTILPQTFCCAMQPWQAWGGLWIWFVYITSMWRLLCESSQSVLSKTRSSAPPSRPFITDVLWKKRGGLFFFFSCRLSGKVLLSHSKYQSTFHFWPLRWLTDRTAVSGVYRKLRLKLITCPFHCFYRNKFK